LVESKYVRVGEINTHYLVAGEGEPVILVHGGGPGVLDWELNIGPLSQHHRVYALDLVGFGYSDKPEVNYTIPYFADFVRHFMDTLELEQVSLVGLCMGGGTTLGVALESPQRVEKLVLVASCGLGKEVGAGIQRLLSRLMPLLPSAFLKRWDNPDKNRFRRDLERMVYDPKVITDDLLNKQYELQSLALDVRLNFWKNFFSFSGQRTNFRNRLHEIAMPTLIICGQEDEVYPLAHAHTAHELINNSQLHIFPKCGHVPPREKPNEFNQLVLDFLK
jgi:proline-specific peptidase